MISGIRSIVQHLSFIVFMYGGRFGLNLGPALPCFACPYVSGCGGYCYLMGLQSYIGFGLNGAALLGLAGLKALGWFLVFTLLVAVFGKTWCGWFCPFGLVQDWLSALRKKLGVREALISAKTMSRLGWIKYILLFCLAAIPPLVTIGLLHPDFHLPFCNICPGKSLLPLFVGETKYLALDMTNTVTLVFSALLLIITGSMLVGMFFKERFFCVFCPLLALIHILKPLTALRLVKEPDFCTGCGTCRRVCPMDIEQVYLEKNKKDVQSDACLDCGHCVESCSSNKALSLNWLRLRLISSSKETALKIFRKKI